MTTFSDPIIQNLHERVQASENPVLEITPALPEKYFQDLAESIIGQQLSIKVAETITNRVRNLVGPEFIPQNILALPHEELRLVGLSNAKANYIRNIAEAWQNGLINPAELTTMPDEEIILLLSEIKGVGRWTAEMFLVFTLGRPDVFSVGDYGLRKAVLRAYELPDSTKPAEIAEIAQKWKPQRSLASRILWRSLDNML